MANKALQSKTADTNPSTRNSFQIGLLKFRITVFDRMFALIPSETRALPQHIYPDETTNLSFKAISLPNYYQI
jgi:hypothetical protein